MNDALVQAALKSWQDQGFSSPLATGIEDGIFWATCRSPAAGVNGYVLVPAEGHAWSNGFGDVELDAVLDVHGGVTYAHHPWIGFDTAHAGDVWSSEYDPLGVTGINRKYRLPYSREWTPELVAQEAQRLARQIAKALYSA